MFCFLRNIELSGYIKAFCKQLWCNKMSCVLLHKGTTRTVLINLTSTKQPALFYVLDKYCFIFTKLTFPQYFEINKIPFLYAFSVSSQNSTCEAATPNSTLKMRKLKLQRSSLDWFKLTQCERELEPKSSSHDCRACKMLSIHCSKYVKKNPSNFISRKYQLN